MKKTGSCWLVFALAAACGDGGGNTGAPDAAGGVDAVGGCSTANCVDPNYCSANGTCIPNGTCATEADCAATENCNLETNLCELEQCGSQAINFEYVAPNLLLVLDRSCSMTDEIVAGGATKWSAATAAVAQLSLDYADTIRWGMTLFPDTTSPNCGQEDLLPYPLADNNAQVIHDAMVAAQANGDINYPNGPCVTNIDTGIQQAATDPGLTATDRASYLMLISDGAQNAGCNLGGNDDGTEAALIELRDQRNIKTFVVGFGAEVSGVTLERFAAAGGTTRPISPAYYQADTAAQLAEAFAEIADSVLSCSFLLDPAPADIDLTFVFFDDVEQISRDLTQTNGWDYDPATMQLTLYGDACDRVRNETVTDVDVVYGCPSPIID